MLERRKLDALCQAGIPIYSFTGTNGRYKILKDFKMNNQLASEDEYANIAAAVIYKSHPIKKQ